MNRTDRDDLLQICRMRVRLTKADVAAVAAERETQFAAQLAAAFDFDQGKIWKQAKAAAEAATCQAQKEIAQRCSELGIPRRFFPMLHLYWYDCGEFGAASRRAELTKVAHTRIEQLKKEARLEIERVSVDFQTRLLADGLELEDARAFLESMPAADQLMPAVTVEQMQTQLTHSARLDDPEDERESTKKLWLT